MLGKGGVAEDGLPDFELDEKDRRGGDRVADPDGDHRRSEVDAQDVAEENGGDCLEGHREHRKKRAEGEACSDFFPFGLPEGREEEAVAEFSV